MDGLVARNPRVKALRRLINSSKERRAAGRYVLEHPVAIAEALAGAADPSSPIDASMIETVWVDEEQVEHFADLLSDAQELSLPATTLAPGVLASISDSIASPGVAATVLRPTTSLEELPEAPAGVAAFELVLVGLADPGNAGTIIRAAEAMGATRVIVAENSADPFGPKCVRATAGSILRMPVVTDVGIEDVLSHLSERRVATLATVVKHGLAPDALDDAVVGGPIAVLVGSEAHGLADEIVQICDHKVTIPLAGTVESLNAAVAISVVGFDLARRRGEAGGAQPGLG